MATVQVVSERQQQNNIQCHLRILLHQSRQTIIYNKFDGIMQTNLSRDKIEIVTRFTTSFQMNRQWGCTKGNFKNKIIKYDDKYGPCVHLFVINYRIKVLISIMLMSLLCIIVMAQGHLLPGKKSVSFNIIQGPVTRMVFDIYR